MHSRTIQCMSSQHTAYPSSSLLVYLFAACSALSSQQLYKDPAITAQDIPGMNCTMYADSDASCCDWCCCPISSLLEFGTSRYQRRISSPLCHAMHFEEGQFLSNMLRISATCSTVRLVSALETHALNSLEYTNLRYTIP